MTSGANVDSLWAIELLRLDHNTATVLELNIRAEDMVQVKICRKHVLTCRIKCYTTWVVEEHATICNLPHEGSMFVEDLEPMVPRISDDDEGSNMIHSYSPWKCKLTVFLTTGAECEQEPTDCIENLNAMVIFVSHVHSVQARVESDATWTAKLSSAASKLTKCECWVTDVGVDEDLMLLSVSHVNHLCDWVDGQTPGFASNYKFLSWLHLHGFRQGFVDVVCVEFHVHTNKRFAQ